MKLEMVRKFILPPGPILSFTLIGILLLSAVIYYRAVKIQRFLEPALAFSQPRMKFSQNIKNLLSKEFGSKETEGVKFAAGSIFVDQSLIFPKGQVTVPGGSAVLRKLGHVFMSALDSPGIRENISLILVSSRVPLSANPGLNRVLRFQLQGRAIEILNELYSAEPEMERRYGKYFASTAVPVVGPPEEADWIEFRIIPTERFHIELLQRLEKYMM